MVKRFCDRCRTEMEDPELASHIDGCFIVKTKSGEITSPWDMMDLCPDCLNSFSDWMKHPGATGTVKPLPFPYGNGSCFLCGCGALIASGQHYCSHCGKEILWDEPDDDTDEEITENTGGENDRVGKTDCPEEGD